MSDEESPTVPVALEGVLASVPAALVPRSVKALDRLVGAAVDIPAAWLEQKTAKIKSQTAAFELVEAAIADAAASEAGGTPEVVQQAVNVLVRKAYRKNSNVQAASVAAIEDLRSNESANHSEAFGSATEEVDVDWLNVFERFAEDASTERMQNLWGRVLAGEIRKPGRFSIRTLRFFSEFSSSDAERFTDISKNFFCGISPKSLINPDDKKDISDLLELEASDLIQGASGLGLSYTITFNNRGLTGIINPRYGLVFKGIPGEEVETSVITMTKLGKELIEIIPGRDELEAARNVGHAMKCDAIEAAFICAVKNGISVDPPLEVLWQS